MHLQVVEETWIIEVNKAYGHTFRARSTEGLVIMPRALANSPQTFWEVNIDILQHVEVRTYK